MAPKKKIRQKKEVKVDFSYYKPINRQQTEFHASGARHKLMLGGYGSGKTYPAIHEAYFTCYENDNHEYLVSRNTWESLIENVWKEFLDVGEKSNAIKDKDGTKHNILLHNNTVIRFRPLSMTRSQFKGMNICGFFIDDPQIMRHKETISFLYSRLRNSPTAKAKYFSSIITANYEGHNWLWQTYMRGREEGGNDKFAYWICPTGDNPTLPPDFISDLASVHSQSWMDRFVYCKMDSYAGLIYDEFRDDIHCKDLSWCFKDDSLIKILAIDVGITDPSVVLKVACDNNNVYVYDEFYKPNIRSSVLGEYLMRENRKDKYRTNVIDRSSTKTEQTSGNSVESDLRRDFKVRLTLSKGDINYGIEKVKTLLTVDKDYGTHMYIDAKRCPHLIREIEMYMWKEPEMSEFDELAMKEKPVDKDNHCVDCLRYSVVYFKKFLRGIFHTESEMKQRRKDLWDERMKLKIYRNKGDSGNARNLARLHAKGRNGKFNPTTNFV